MEQQISAYQFTNVYENLGISLSKLGCIMLDIEPDDLEERVRDVVDAGDVYSSEDPASHIEGIVAGQPHVTLLYGLLRTGTEMKKHVLEVLEGGEVLPTSVEVSQVGYFESQRDDEPYYCIVAHIEMSPELEQANERLKFLPHLNTFPGYKAHMTLVYIRKDDTLRDAVVSYLDSTLKGRKFNTVGLNFGDL